MTVGWLPVVDDLLHVIVSFPDNVWILRKVVFGHQLPSIFLRLVNCFDVSTLILKPAWINLHKVALSVTVNTDSSLILKPAWVNLHEVALSVTVNTNPKGGKSTIENTIGMVS